MLGKGWDCAGFDPSDRCNRVDEEGDTETFGVLDRHDKKKSLKFFKVWPNDVCLYNKIIRVNIRVIEILTHIHVLLGFYFLIYDVSPITWYFDPLIFLEPQNCFAISYRFPCYFPCSAFIKVITISTDEVVDEEFYIAIC